MAKNLLSDRKVKTAQPGIYSDGGGLLLCVSENGARTWVYRFSWNGRRPEMGLGAIDDVCLSEARELRDAARKVLRAGRNPIDARRDQRKADGGRKTFGEVADALIESKSGEWRNAKHKEQWRVSLVNGAAVLRPKLVDEIDTASILEALKPIWSEKPESASRLRQRIEAVLDAARAQGLRSGENPARWRGHLSHLLARRQKLSRGHFAALPYATLPAFMSKLRGVDTTAARALEFAILTAARSGEVYGALWSEIDMGAKVWTIPAARMKSGREHRIPLCDHALEILAAQKATRIDDHVFPGQKRGNPLSHVAMAKVINRLGVTNATVHGFRSAFRDWAGNETHFAREVAEAALAHVVGDSAEQAYRRGDALEKRRALMEAWAGYCEPKATGRAAVLKFPGVNAS